MGKRKKSKPCDKTIVINGIKPDELKQIFIEALLERKKKKKKNEQERQEKIQQQKEALQQKNEKIQDQKALLEKKLVKAALKIHNLIS